LSSTSIVSMLRTAVVVCALVSPCSGLKFASTGLNYASTGRASSAVAFLSPTTFDAVSESRIHGDADAFFDKVDDDGNGQISFDELTEHLTAMGFQPSGIDHIFDLLDINRDGEITREELRESFVTFDDAALRMALGLGETEADKVFNSIDTNGDGEISKEELSAHLLDNGYEQETADSVFEALDENGDGFISREELHEGYTSYSALRKILGLPLIMQLGFKFGDR